MINRSLYLLPLLWLTTSVFASANAQEPLPLSPALSKIHSSIEDSYPQLSHVSADEISALLDSERGDVLLLDVRKDKEYAVSHIDGALRVDPDISPEDFAKIYGDQIEGKNVVLYCSVGRRSSRLGDRLQTTLNQHGAQSVSNLEGGIFSWHNNAQPLVSGTQETDKVHPYNAWWGRLVNRKDGIAYSSKP